MVGSNPGSGIRCSEKNPPEIVLFLRDLPGKIDP